MRRLAAGILLGVALTWSMLLATAAPGAAATTPASIANLTAVTCPTQTICYAVGSTTTGSGVLLQTNNGGIRWWRRDIPDTVGDLLAVTCTSPQTCVAVGSDTDNVHAALIQTADGGAIWTVDAPPVDQYGEPVSSLTGVRCPTATTCVASGYLPGGGGAAAETTDGGHSWTATSLSNDAVQDAVSCPRTSDCFVVGAAYSGSDFIADIEHSADGVIWTRSFSYPASAAGSGVGWQLNSVSCPSPTDCVAVGGSSPGPGGAQTDIFTTVDGGTTWTLHPAPQGVVGLPYDGGLAGVACPRPTDCYAVGGPDVIDTTNSTWTWGEQTVPSGVSALDGIACPVYFRCYAVGGASIIATTDSGQHWNRDAVS